MQFSIHINGNYQIELKPETPIESSVLVTMAQLAKNGVTVTLETVPDGFVVSVPK